MLCHLPQLRDGPNETAVFIQNSSLLGIITSNVSITIINAKTYEFRSVKFIFSSVHHPLPETIIQRSPVVGHIL